MLSSYCKGIVACAIVCSLLPGARDARAETDADVRCRRLRAEADSTADLLYAPSLSVQAFHVPTTGAPDPDTFVGDGYRARAMLTFAPLDLLRARRVVGAADADCDATRDAEVLERVLAQGVQYGRAAALRAQIARLDASLDRVDELLADAAARRERQIITLVEQNELTMRALRLRRQRAEAREELALLDAQGHDEELPPAAWDQLARHERRTMDAERDRSALRRLAGWQVDLQVGAGPDDPVDWYAMVGLSIDLGVIGQARAERRYLRARADELAGDDAALRARLERFRDTMATSADDLGEELALVREQLALIADERTQLARRSVDASRQLDAVLELDEIELEARRAYLQQLIDTRQKAGSAGAQHP
jgi:hypothetical protein